MEQLRTEGDGSARGAALETIAAALARIRFGDIRLTIHEGRPVQIEVTEKTRLPTS